MSYEEAELLRERANAFLKNAEDLLSKGVYDLAAFNIEQYCQLILKYKLLVYVGTYPRTSSLTRLIKDLSAVNKIVGELLKKEEYILYLTKIEDAYVGARYLGRRYHEIEVSSMLRFVKEVFKPIVEKV